MRLPPADVLQKWPNPNYEDPETRGHTLVVVNAIFIGLVIITVGLRLYTRIWIKRWFGLDDVFILLALLFTIGLTATVLLATQRYGWNRHIYDISLDMFVPTLQIAMAAKIIFTAAATFTRLSLHCFYYRLVSDTGKTWFRWLIHANVVYTIGIFISFTFIAVFMCDPVQNYWKLGTPEGSCMDEGIATLICGIINSIADFATTITPMPLVIGLKMPRRQRFAVAILFGLGIIVTAAGIVRTWFIYRSLFGEYDRTWYAYPLWIAAAIEIDLGVICASAPVLRPLLTRLTFSSAETFSCGLSNKKSTRYAWDGFVHPTSLGSVANTAASSSKRRSVAITGVPELETDNGKSYELYQWGEVERGTPENNLHRDNEENTLEGPDQVASKWSIKKPWEMVTKKKDRSDRTEENMTITRTSEFDVRITAATGSNSKRSSRHPPPALPTSS